MACVSKLFNIEYFRGYIYIDIRFRTKNKKKIIKNYKTLINNEF
jgi:hypothetical protein